MVETEYQSGSPVGTGWSYYTPYFGATPSTSITPVSPYVNWTTWAYINNSNEPFIASIFADLVTSVALELKAPKPPCSLIA